MKLLSGIHSTDLETLTGDDSANMVLEGLGEKVHQKVKQNVKVLYKF